LDVDVDVKFTGTPAQTLSGEAVKFAVGACAIAVKKLPINAINNMLSFIGPSRTSKIRK
jgi:hypothetical protein